MKLQRLTPLVALFLAAAGLPAGFAAEESSLPPAEMIARLLEEVPLIDGHNDLPWAIRERFGSRLAGVDLNDTSRLDPPLATDLRRLRAGGVGGVFWSVWVPAGLGKDEAVRTVLEQIDLVHRMAAAYPADLEIALTAAEVRRIHAAGRVASLIGAEGGHSIADSPAVLRMLYAAGARYLTLTHWDSTAWADAATAAPQHGGLTDFGAALVREMNRLGMLVDLSHVSAAAMHDALDASRAPVIFSHSCAAALNPHPRNVPDDVLRRLPANGGLVMVNFGSYFIDPRVTERVAAGEAEETRLKALHPGDLEAVQAGLDRWYAANPMPRVTISQLADHIDHIRRIAGIDHVGLGSDFDGLSSLPEGLEDVSGYPRLLAELARRGYSRDDLARVAGLNLLRAMAEAERVAATLQISEAPLERRLDDPAPPAPQPDPSH
ncbi:MAG TPA: dipeptidase [Thermoanaerobaculales bacterium]|nr:dipeptidase [Thermoanaerobaculales bacterium]HPA79947.1 dipeptidase [Thermoanaerobaculales bacterium]HQL29198.1 dipeptidase [Thermoanaerobaculales bacterium]HQN95614.1 dipeptidase [Thermoanaerobaculales bacterium]HQP43917.1 dipeptidase [Thermoanaerobaculales bacterium]